MPYYHDSALMGSVYISLSFPRSEAVSQHHSTNPQIPAISYSVMNTADATARPASTKSKRKSKRRSDSNGPHLPKEFLEERMREPAMQGLSSTVFTSYMRQVRLDTMNPHSDEVFDPNSAVPPGTNKRQDRTLLHFAAVTSDHLLAYESIRQASNITLKPKLTLTCMLL